MEKRKYLTTILLITNKEKPSAYFEKEYNIITCKTAEEITTVLNNSTHFEAAICCEDITSENKNEFEKIIEELTNKKIRTILYGEEKKFPELPAKHNIVLHTNDTRAITKELWDLSSQYVF